MCKGPAQAQLTVSWVRGWEEHGPPTPPVPGKRSLHSATSIYNEYLKKPPDYRRSNKTGISKSVPVRSSYLIGMIYLHVGLCFIRILNVYVLNINIYHNIENVCKIIVLLVVLL